MKRELSSSVCALLALSSFTAATTGVAMPVAQSLKGPDSPMIPGDASTTPGSRRRRLVAIDPRIHTSVGHLGVIA